MTEDARTIDAYRSTLVHRGIELDGVPSGFWAMVESGELSSLYPTADTGWTRYGIGRDFQFADVNLVPDPQGTLANGTFWPASITNTALTANEDLPVAWTGEPTVTKCLKLVNDGTSSQPVTATMAVTASKDHFASLYVYAPTLGGNLTIRADTGTIYVVGQLTEANTGWVRYDVYFKTGAAETTVRLKFNFAGGTASTVYVTAAQVQQAFVLTAYHDGTCPDSAWSGTAHNSTSVRVKSNLTYAAPATVPAAGTFACRIVAPQASTGLSVSSALMAYMSGTTTYEVVLRWSSATIIRMYVGAAYAAITGLTYSRGDILTIVGRWDAGGIYINVNGVDGATIGAAPTTGNAVARLQIGARYSGDSSGAYDAKGFVGPCLRRDGCASAAWVAAIQDDSGAAFADPALLASGFMDPGNRFYPLESDSVGFRKVSGEDPFESAGGQVIFDGDSLTASAAVSDPFGKMPYLTMQAAGWPGTFYVVEAAGGQDSQDLIDNQATVLARYQADAGPQIVSVWIGANDPYTPIDAATCYSNIVTYCGTLQTAGFKIIIGTILPNLENAGQYAHRAAVNANIRANWETFADAIADIAANTTIGDDGDETNTTYYQADKTHLTAAGNAIVASIVGPAIEGLL